MTTQPGIKVVIAGESGVGKTSVLRRYCEGKYDQNSTATVGSAFFTKHVQTQNSMLTLNLWDTAGQERFQSLLPMYLRGAQVCIITTDAVNIPSVDEFSIYYYYIADQIDIESILVIAVNKIDLMVDESENLQKLKLWCKENKVPIYLVSAKLGNGIADMFNEIVLHLEEKISEMKAAESIDIVDPENGKKSCCN